MPHIASLIRFEMTQAPVVVDAKGGEVPLPVLKPSDQYEAEQRSRSAGRRDLAVLRAVAADPQATVRGLVDATGISKSAIDRQLKTLEARKLIAKDLVGGWSLTKRGREQVDQVGSPQWEAA